MKTVVIVINNNENIVPIYLTILKSLLFIKNLFLISKIVDAKGKNDVDVDIDSPNLNYPYRKII